MSLKLAINNAESAKSAKTTKRYHLRRSLVQQKESMVEIDSALSELITIVEGMSNDPVKMDLVKVARRLNKAVNGEHISKPVLVTTIAKELSKGDPAAFDHHVKTLSKELAVDLSTMASKMPIVKI